MGVSKRKLCLNLEVRIIYKYGIFQESMRQKKKSKKTTRNKHIFINVKPNNALYESTSIRQETIVYNENKTFFQFPLYICS